jgi:hypothetical protein
LEVGFLIQRWAFCPKSPWFHTMFYPYVRVKLHRQICGGKPFVAAKAALPSDHVCVMQH